MAKSGLVLLTGATGFVGFRTLVRLLDAGFHVRAAVRSESKGNSVAANSAIKDLNLSSSALTFAIVPDITAEGAYTDAIKGVNYVIHVASPIPTHNMDGHKNAQEVFIRPAVRGVLEMLNAANSEPNVRKVVITSSVVAQMQPPIWLGLELSDVKYDEQSRTTASAEGPFDNPAAAYCASKINALNETDAWVEREKPSFSIFNVHPSWVLGPADLVESREELMGGTSKYMVAVALGRPQEIIGDRTLTGASVHVDDVALAQVKALQDDGLTGYKSLVTSVPMSWHDIPQLVGNNFPDAVRDRLLSTEGIQPTAPLDIDASATEKILGMKFRGVEEQLKDLLNQYIKLPDS